MNKEFREILNGAKRALSLLDPREQRSLVLATCIMLVTGVLTNLPALILGRLVDALSGGEKITLELVTPFIAAIIIIILVREALTVFRKYLVENIATQTDKEQTVKMISRLLRADIRGFLYTTQIGSLHGKVFRSMQGLISMIKLIFLDFAPVFFTAIAAIVIALYQKPLIGTVMILVIPSGLYLIVKQISSQKGIRVSLLRGKEKVDGNVIEMLGGIETIRVMNTAPFEIQRIEDLAEQTRKTEIKHHIYMALFDAAKYLNEGFFYILVIIISIFLAGQGIISRGDILVYSILFLSITSPLREIHRILDEAHESSLLVKDLYSLQHQPLDKSFTEKKREKSRQKPVEMAVQFKNVSFSYNGEEKMLKNISLAIKNGVSIGIAGASGCGKSTFIHLLVRLLHDYAGSIELFGENLNDVSREEIAKRIAYVPQSPYVFSGTVKDNLLYGISRAVSDKELKEAAQKAQLYDELKDSLGGFSGKVAENGNNLSGGQRQRIALTRVFLSEADLIIFDEATSALDNTNEAVILERIEKEFKGKTMIMIAHRLTTLKNCDRIVVFDEGKIAQEGTYSVLAKTKGLFKNFLEQRATEKI